MDPTPEIYAFPILSLPPELVIKILDKLAYRSLNTCRAVSHSLKNFVDENANLQHILELAAANMEDGPTSSLSTAERLDALKKHQVAWNKLDWTRVDTLEMMGGNVWELYGGVLAQARYNNSVLYFRQLPSSLRGIEQKEWEVNIAEFHARDFTLDPAQDLLVLVNLQILPSWEFPREVTVHLRSATTGALHPLAVYPGKLTQRTETEGHLSFNIQVCGDMVATMYDNSGDLGFGDGDSELVIWNWKTGRRIMNIISSEGMSTFAFITSRYLLVGLNLEPHTHNMLPRLLVMDIERGTGEKTNVHEMDYVCSFEYPAFQSFMNPFAFMIRSDPSPVWQPSPSSQLPFSLARERRLFVISLTFGDHEGGVVWSYDMFVPTDTFMTCIRKLPVDGDLEGEPHAFDWEDWGPWGTRLLPSIRTSDVWVCYVCGMKFVTFNFERLEGHERVLEYTIQVLDFNQLALRRASNQPLEGNVELITDPSHLTDVENFGPNLLRMRTALPYRLIKRKLPLSLLRGTQLNGIMCSEDGLVLVVGRTEDREFRVLSF